MFKPNSLLKNAKQLVLICTLVFGLLVSGINTVNAQSSSISVMFEDSQISLERGEQAEVSVFVTNANSYNSIFLEIVAEGGINILDVQADQDQGEFLEAGKIIEDQRVEIGIAKTDNFIPTQIVAKVTIAMVGDEGGRLNLTNRTTVADTAVETGTAIEIGYTGGTFEDDSAAQNDFAADFIAQVQSFLQTQNAIFLLAAAGVLILIFLVLMALKSLMQRRKKKPQPQLPPVDMLPNLPSMQDNNQGQQPQQTPASVAPAVQQPTQVVTPQPTVSPTPVAQPQTQPVAQVTAEPIPVPVKPAPAAQQPITQSQPSASQQTEQNTQQSVQPAPQPTQPVVAAAAAPTPAPQPITPAAQQPTQPIAKPQPIPSAAPVAQPTNAQPQPVTSPVLPEQTPTPSLPALPDQNQPSGQLPPL